MKQFTDFRIFKKAVRKYWKRYATKSHFTVDGKQLVSWWTDKIWCYYIVDTQEDLQDKKILDWFKFDIDPDYLQEYINNVKLFIGSPIILFSDMKGDITKGDFVGFALVNNGVFYAIKNEDKTISLYNLGFKIKSCK